LNEDQPLFEPRYDITSAAHHLGIPRSTLNAWVNGQPSFESVLTLPSPGYLSFVNLTEAFILLTMRRHYRITMQRIRNAIDYIHPARLPPLVINTVATEHRHPLAAGWSSSSSDVITHTFSMTLPK